MANRIVRVHAVIYGIAIYVIMLPSSGFLVTHCKLNICNMIHTENQITIQVQSKGSLAYRNKV